MTRDTHLAVVGTYRPAESEGVFSLQVDCETGAMEVRDAVVAGPDPSFVTVSPDGSYVYAAAREDEGMIAAYEIDRVTGELTALNRASTGSTSPAYCSVDATGQYLLVAHYHGGAVSMLPLETDGRVGDPVRVIEHEGSSVHRERQTDAHPHSITPGPENRFAYVPDLGLDQVVIYEMDVENGGLTRYGEVAVEPGAGPRHLEFAPDGRHVYLINELDSTLEAFERDDDGHLHELTTVSTLPADFEGENLTADVHVHPTGRYVYGSNRGHDTIAGFKAENGDLTPIGHTATGGEWPRHFAVDPHGKTLFAENRHTDDITAFSIDADTGYLAQTGERVSIPEPVCMQWVP